jgi:hypothetical protein
VCVYVCVRVCVHIYLHTCIYVYRYTHTYSHTYFINKHLHICIQPNTPQSEAPSNALPSKQAGIREMRDGGSTDLRGYAERPTSPVLLRSRSPLRGSPVRGYSEVQKMPASYGLMMEGQAEVLFHN